MRTVPRRDGVPDFVGDGDNWTMPYSASEPGGGPKPASVDCSLAAEGSVASSSALGVVLERAGSVRVGALEAEELDDADAAEAVAALSVGGVGGSVERS